MNPEDILESFLEIDKLQFFSSSREMLTTLYFPNCVTIVFGGLRIRLIIPDHEGGSPLKAEGAKISGNTLVPILKINDI